MKYFTRLILILLTVPAVGYSQSVYRIVNQTSNSITVTVRRNCNSTSCATFSVGPNGDTGYVTNQCLDSHGNWSAYVGGCQLFPTNTCTQPEFGTAYWNGCGVPPCLLTNVPCNLTNNGTTVAFAYWKRDGVVVATSPIWPGAVAYYTFQNVNTCSNTSLAYGFTITSVSPDPTQPSVYTAPEVTGNGGISGGGLNPPAGASPTNAPGQSGGASGGAGPIPQYTTNIINSTNSPINFGSANSDQILMEGFSSVVTEQRNQELRQDFAASLLQSTSNLQAQVARNSDYLPQLTNLTRLPTNTTMVVSNNVSLTNNLTVNATNINNNTNILSITNNISLTNIVQTDNWLSNVISGINTNYSDRDEHPESAEAGYDYSKTLISGKLAALSDFASSLAGGLDNYETPGGSGSDDDTTINLGRFGESGGSSILDLDPLHDTDMARLMHGMRDIWKFIISFAWWTAALWLGWSAASKLPAIPQLYYPKVARALEEDAAELVSGGLSEIGFTIARGVVKLLYTAAVVLAFCAIPLAVVYYFTHGRGAEVMQPLFDGVFGGADVSGFHTKSFQWFNACFPLHFALTALATYTLYAVSVVIEFITAAFLLRWLLSVQEK